MANSNKDGLAGSIAGELHIGIQGPPGPVGPQGPVGPVGPEATPLTVVISGTAASHSASEIIAAIKAEKIVEVNMGTERLQVTAWDESAVTVTCAKAPAPNRSGALLSCNVYTISDGKTVSVVANSAISSKISAKAGQAIVVAGADPNGPTSFVGADIPSIFTAQYGTTTFTEIANAVSAGKTVECRKDYIVLPMLRFSPQASVITFGGTADGQSVTWKLSLGVWSEGNVQIGTGGGVFVVNLDLVEQDNGEPMLVPDKTFTEIKTAIDAGQDVTAVVTQVGIVLHVLQYDESKVTFAYSFVEKTDLGTSYTTMQVIVQSDGNVVSDIVTDSLVTEVSSGVYVGSGDMPEDCNVQIDPDGEALDLNALIDARIEVALGVIENGTY